MADRGRRCGGVMGSSRPTRLGEFHVVFHTAMVLMICTALEPWFVFHDTRGKGRHSDYLYS